MSLTVFIAVILAAFLHAVWNAMVKKGEDKYISLTAVVLGHYIPVGITYATWSGLGIAAITIIGIFKYNQVPNIPTIIGLTLIIIGVVIVNTMSEIKVN